VTNPVTKYEIRNFTPDDISQVMENFFDVVAWATSESVHVHHIQTVTVDVSGQAATSQVNYTGLTWPQAFPSGVTPLVLASANSTAAAMPANGEKLTFGVYNITNTGCSVRVNNTGTGAVGSTVLVALVAIDPTFNTSLA